MKIQELIVESQVTDEGVLGSIASGAGTALGAVGKGLGAISGAFKGAKDQFQKGQALGRAHVGGHMPKQPKDTSVRDQEFARLTGKATPGAPNAAGGDPKALRAQAADLNKQADEMEKQQQAAQKQAAAAQPAQPLETPPPTQPGIGQSSNTNNAVSTNTAPADTKVTPNVGGAPAPTAPSMKPMQTPGAGTNPKQIDAATQARIDAAPQGYDPDTGKPLPASQPSPADVRQQKQAAAAQTAQQQMAANPAPAPQQPNLQVQQGGKNPALDARRAALAQSKADTAAGKGVTGAIKSGTLGEGFYSKFFDALI